MLKNNARIHPALAERIDAVAAANGLDTVLEPEGNVISVIRFVDAEGHALAAHVTAGRDPNLKPAINLNVFEEREMDDWLFANLVDVERIGPPAGYDSHKEFEEKLSLVLPGAIGSIDHTWRLTDESRVVTHPLALFAVDALGGDIRLSLTPWRKGDDEGITVRSGPGREANVTFGYGSVEIVSPDFAESVPSRGLQAQDFERRIRRSVEQALAIGPQPTP